MAWLAGGALLCAACSGDGAEPTTFERVPETVALGALPEPLTSSASTVPPPATTPITTVDEDEIEPIEGQVGEVVTGNRLLLIGDSAMAALTPRHDGIACSVLPELGWEVEIEAEMARYLPFADEVIDEVVVDAGEKWDVIGLMFGHLLDTSVEEFGNQLERIIGRLSSRPVLLYTITQEDDAAAELNETIRAIGEERPNVVIVDWGAAVAFEQIVDLTGDDNLPNEEGMGRIVLLTAAALGEPSSGGRGTCLEPRFTDDSAIVIES